MTGQTIKNQHQEDIENMRNPHMVDIENISNKHKKDKESWKSTQGGYGEYIEISTRWIGKYQAQF